LLSAATNLSNRPLDVDALRRGHTCRCWKVAFDSDRRGLEVAVGERAAFLPPTREIGFTVGATTTRSRRPLRFPVNVIPFLGMRGDELARRIRTEPVHDVVDARRRRLRA
jgi:hypothetical protein